MTCGGKLNSIGSDNVQATSHYRNHSWNVLFGRLRTNFNGILIEIIIFSLMKIRLKMSSAKCRPFCLGLNVFTWHVAASFCLSSTPPCGSQTIHNMHYARQATLITLKNRSFEMSTLEYKHWPKLIFATPTHSSIAPRGGPFLPHLKCTSLPRDSKFCWSHIGPTWILSAPRWANAGPTCLTISVYFWHNG